MTLASPRAMKAPQTKHRGVWSLQRLSHPILAVNFATTRSVIVSRKSPPPGENGVATKEGLSELAHELRAASIYGCLWGGGNHAATAAGRRPRVRDRRPALGCGQILFYFPLADRIQNLMSLSWV